MRLHTVSVRKLTSLLRSLGFEEDRRKDHVFFYFKCGDRIVVRTKISHGATEISQPMLGLIGKQLRFDRQELERFLQGRMSQIDYENLLHAKNIC